MVKPFIQILLQDIKSKIGTFTFILILAFLAGCRSSKTTTTETIQREYADTVVKIPSDSAKIVLDLKTKAEKDGVIVDWSKIYIPPTTQYSNNGRTKVTVELKDGKLQARADVDVYEQEIKFLRELITKEKKVEPQPIIPLWLVILILLPSLITLIKK